MVQDLRGTKVVYLEKLTKKLIAYCFKTLLFFSTFGVCKTPPTQFIVLMTKTVQTLFVVLMLQPFALVSQNAMADSLVQVIRTSSSETDRLHATALFAQELMPAQMDSALVLLNQSSMLEKSRQLIHRADYYNVWGLYYWFTGDRKASKEWFRKTLALPGAADILFLQAAAANNIGCHHAQTGHPDSARYYYLMSLDIDKQRGNDRGIAKNYYDLSRLHHGMDQYELAYRYVNQAITLQHQGNNKSALNASYNLKANILSAMGSDDQAIALYEKLLEEALEHGDHHHAIILYNNLTAIYSTQENGYNKVDEYFRLGLELARSNSRDDLTATLFTNKGQSLLTAGKPRSAINYFQEALEMIKEEGHTQLEMGIAYRLGKAYREVGDHNNARELQRRSLEIATHRQSLDHQSKALLEIAVLDSLGGDFQGFARNYIKGIALRDSIWSQENRSRIAELQIIHETEQKKLQIEELLLRKKAHHLHLMLLIGGSALVLTLMALLTLFLRKRQKLDRKQLQLREVQQQQLECELESNRRELTGKALTLAKSEQLITRLKKDLRDILDNKQGDYQQDLRAALRLLKAKDNGLQLWKDFQTRFDELNEGFISHLLRCHPSLSPSEIRLCALLRMQLTTKEIAEMLNRSTRTIEHTRNSIRKKMKLNPTDNLTKYLIEL
jgi:tetratricopeptide (TPR) repeat protein